MTKEFRSYLFRISILSALAFIGVWMIQSKGLVNLPRTFVYGPVFFFMLLSLVLNLLLMKAAQKNAAVFIRTFLASQALKMFIHLIVMTAVAFIFPERAVHFIAVYAVLYMAFTVTELVTLLPLVRKSGS